jgi:hypothetical protein
MNALTTLFSSHLPRPRNHVLPVALATRPARRERAFGVGYGSSSGYATAGAYVAKPAASHFRFV